MNRIIVISALAAALAACAAPAPAPAPQNAPPRTASPLPYTPVPRRPTRSEARDTCGAQALQHLVGKSRTQIPVPVDVSRRRVACTTCPVTMDFREDRLNIFFDATTGIIKEVKCG